VARRAILACIIAIALVNLAGPIRNAVIDRFGTGVIQQPELSASLLGLEVEGVIMWIQMTLAVIAVLVLIISGIRAVANYGSDEGIADLRRTVIAVIAGFTLIFFKYVLTDAFAVTKRPEGILAMIIDILNMLLMFLALVAATVIVIAGIMMILNLGDDTQYQRARDLIIRVAIGLLVIIVSWALINFVFLALVFG